MEPVVLTISLEPGAEIKGINVRAGARKNYDTLVDIQIGPVVITAVAVIDDHVSSATAYLPRGLQISDTDLEDRIKGVALSFHYGVDEESMKEEDRPRE